MEQLLTLNNLNKNYKNKRSISLIIVDIFFAVYMLIFLCYVVFCIVFIQAEVIGYSMQPTFNAELVYPADADASKYKDVIYANRFKKGTNGDIVLAEMNNGLVIKRVIATSNQVVILSKDVDGYFYYYVASSIADTPTKLNEYYIADRQDMDNGYFERFINMEGAEETISGQTAIYVVPENCVFLLGDNRLRSEDSLIHGAININKVSGKVEFWHKYNSSLIGYLWQQICSIF